MLEVLIFVTFIAIIVIVGVNYNNSSVQCLTIDQDNGVADKIGIRSHKAKAKALVLSCIDYRFINQTIEYLYGINNQADFDYFVLAGASLGYNESEARKEGTKCWSESYREHIDIAVKLHHIEEIIVIDHMDCGFYQNVYGDAVNTPEKEKAKHEINIVKFIDTLKTIPEYSKFRYTGILLELEPHTGGEVSFRVIFSDD